MRSYILIIVLGIHQIIFAQTGRGIVSKSQSNDPEKFPELVFENIKGAPKLRVPKLLLTTDLKPIIAEGHGWAAPAVWDWDGDGKKDLLIGEFGSGMEDGQNIGNFVRVYFNQGSDDEPQFSGEFDYAELMNGNAAPSGIGDGVPISISTWCCMAFRPQFYDLNNDGYKDIITGSYNPGEVTWFKGSKKGFYNGEKLPQAGDPRKVRESSKARISVTDTNSVNYWQYSSVSFGDFDGDGDLDMIVGGAALRISKNNGTKSEPKFGLRELLLDEDDKPLIVYEATSNEKFPATIKEFPSGTYSCVPLVVDWDQDGVLDILVTTGYYKSGYSAVLFFKGLATADGFRFEKGVPLFYNKAGGKSFPGSWLRLYVTDWNNDGINDLLIGTSVIELEGTFNHNLSWDWEEEMNTLKKNPGYYKTSQKRKIAHQIEVAEKKEREIGVAEMKKRRNVTKDFLMENYYGIPRDSTLVHKGYVYLLLGEK